jgi:hypothetical protein
MITGSLSAASCHLSMFFWNSAELTRAMMPPPVDGHSSRSLPPHHPEILEDMDRGRRSGKVNIFEQYQQYDPAFCCYPQRIAAPRLHDEAAWRYGANLWESNRDDPRPTVRRSTGTLQFRTISIEIELAMFDFVLNLPPLDAGPPARAIGHRG